MQSSFLRSNIRLLELKNGYWQSGKAVQSSLLRSNIWLLELEWLLAIGSTVQSSFLRSNIRQLELKTDKLHCETVTELAICN